MIKKHIGEAQFDLAQPKLELLKSFKRHKNFIHTQMLSWTISGNLIGWQIKKKKEHSLCLRMFLSYRMITNCMYYDWTVEVFLGENTFLSWAVVQQNNSNLGWTHIRSSKWPLQVIGRLMHILNRDWKRYCMFGLSEMSACFLNGVLRLITPARSQRLGQLPRALGFRGVQPPAGCHAARLGFGETQRSALPTLQWG